MEADSAELCLMGLSKSLPLFVLKSSSLVPQNVSLYGSRIIADTIR